MQEVTADSAGVITAGARVLHWPLTEAETSTQVRQALDEDAAFHDVSTLATVQSDRRSHATLVARRPGVIAGVPLAIAAFRQLDASVAIRVAADDGAAVAAGEPVLMLTGHARGLLSAERTALNYLQHLSGIATLTHAFVARLYGLRTRVFDTRKTRPGWRLLEKYAVRAGGGVNHRVDLRSAVLIKDNHLAAVDGRVEVAVARARALAADGAMVQVECDTLDQVDAALAAGADAVLLDNMSVEQLTTAVARIAGRAITEASGGVTLDTVRAIASSGVDRVSIGALTHSAPALDLALDFHP
jgi:nicotinate-nucleotide pyrophosphorylase (carboxylating)